MRTNLNVPYAEKDEAKRLGARWDAARKTWYVLDAKHLEPFIRWMPDGEDWAKQIRARKKEARKPARAVKVGHTFPDHAEPLYSGDAPPWDG